MQRNKRRTLMVDKISQTKYAATVVLYLILHTVIISFLVYLPTIVVLGEEDAPIEKKIEAAKQFFFLEERYLPVIILAMLAMGLHSIIITNRFFGPIMRFKLATRRLAEGKIGEKVSRRKKDYLKDFEDEFNNMVNALNMRFLEISNLTFKNSKIVDELKNAGEGGFSKEQMKEKLSEIKCNLEEIEKLSLK